MPGILDQRLGEKTEQDIEPTTASPPEPDTNSRSEDYMTEKDIREIDAIEKMMSEESFQLEKKRGKLFRRLSTVFLTIACTYLVILIYGSFITEFYYDGSGKIAPVIMTVSDISAKNEYNNIIGMYLQTRSLYETLLTLDYRMAAGAEDTMAIAPEYEKTLDTVSSLTTQIDAAIIDSKYTQVKNMLLTWVQTHAAAYCQYMSAAITQNDSNAAAEAIAARQVLNDNFQLITQNVITLGEDIKGYDLADIKNWSPEGYVQETIEGIKTESSTSIAQTETSSEITAETSESESDSQTEGVPAGLQSDFSLQ